MPRPDRIGLCAVPLLSTVACRSEPVSAPITPASTPVSPSIRMERVGGRAITPTHPGQAPPTFDEADVRAYVQGHPNVSHGLDPGPATVDSIEFMSLREFRARSGSGSDFGKPDDAVLCVVTVHGLFFRAPESTAPSLQTMRVIFDGRTGNELLLTRG